MNKRDNFLFFLGSRFDWPLKGNRFFLPSYLAKKGNQVLVVERPSFKNILCVLFTDQDYIEKKNKNLFVVKTLGVLPYSKAVRIIEKINYWLNLWFIRKKLKSIFTPDLICWSFAPEVHWLIKSIVSRLKIYHVIDDYLSYRLYRGLIFRQRFRADERNMLKIADLVLVTSRSLYEKYHYLHKNTHYLPNASEVEEYLKKKSSVIEELELPTERPIVGFIGGIEKYRFDLGLLEYLARKLKEANFVLVGPIGITSSVSGKILPRRQNIFYLGYKNFSKLPAYVDRFDVGIIPYKENRYGKMCFPIKVFEYLALGKPVVTTKLLALTDLEKKGLIYMAKNKEEFVNCIKRALQEKSSLLKKARIKEARKNSWSKRVDDYLLVINKFIRKSGL
jgi:glycosyltransferase involved in cell wall biosynthesis